VLSHFSEQPPVKYFVAQVRRNKVPRPATLAALNELKPTNSGNKLSAAGFVQCDVSTTEMQAWPLGTIGTDDHQLHVTSDGTIMSLSTHLTYEGKTVIDEKHRWPLKVLVPFDISTLDDDLVFQIVDRIEALATQSH
jgi:hypothetical protein